jgi:hypothetical protein
LTPESARSSDKNVFPVAEAHFAIVRRSPSPLRSGNIKVFLIFKDEKY